MLAVWTFWESATPYTASVSDLQNNGVFNGTIYVYPSAVGPTLQTVSNTSAQILYAKDITGSGVGHYDTVTVTFTCTSTPTICATSMITSGGIVAVEYSGADTMYPLDSSSAGYSTSGNPTSLLDSGTVAPANANLLVFGGGTIDTPGATAVAGSLFTAVQHSGGSITEQLINTSPNNVLQRATAGLSVLGTGNWVMQMAIFRDASWTVANGFGPVRNGQIHADQFPGVNSAAQADSAAPGGITEGTVILPPSMALNGADCTNCTWNQPNVGANFGTTFWDLRKGFYLQSSLDNGVTSNSTCCGFVEGVIGQANFVSPLWTKVYPPTLSASVNRVDSAAVFEMCLNGQGTSPECSAGDIHTYNANIAVEIAMEQEDPANDATIGALAAIHQV